MVINKSGITIRIGVDTLRIMGRATQGVKIIRLKEDDKIASVAKVSKWESAEKELNNDETNTIENEEETEDKNISKETENNEENTNEKN